jgi:hypothetical protein
MGQWKEIVGIFNRFLPVHRDKGKGPQPEGAALSQWWSSAT